MRIFDSNPRLIAACGVDPGLLEDRKTKDQGERMVKPMDKGLKEEKLVEKTHKEEKLRQDNVEEQKKKKKRGTNTVTVSHLRILQKLRIPIPADFPLLLLLLLLPSSLHTYLSQNLVSTHAYVHEMFTAQHTLCIKLHQIDTFHPIDSIFLEKKSLIFFLLFRSDFYLMLVLRSLHVRALEFKTCGVL